MRRLLGLAALPVLVLAVVVLLLQAWDGASASGIGYVVSFTGLPVAALAFASTRLRTRAPAIAAAALGGLALIAAARLASVDRGKDVAVTHGETKSARFVNRLLDEEDLAVGASRLIGLTGFMKDPDIPLLPPAMHDAYRDLRESQGAVPSPVAATYLSMQSASNFDVIEVGDPGRAAGVVIFLHGFAGSFTLPCWIVAEAAARAGFATVCPATGWRGDWWSRQGRTIIERTMASVRAHGAKHVVLAGLSNGAVGASMVAPRYRDSLDGLILVSGATSDARSAAPLPTLVLQGRTDAMMPAAIARRYASAQGRSARYVELAAGHFAMLLRRSESQAAIAEWLQERRGRSVEASMESRMTPHEDRAP